MPYIVKKKKIDASNGAPDGNSTLPSSQMMRERSYCPDTGSTDISFGRGIK